MSTSLSFPDSRSKWKKRKKDTTLGSNSKRQRPEDEDDDEEEDDDVDADEDEDLHPINTARPTTTTTGAPASAAPDSGHDTRESEVLSDGGVRISDFPAVIKHTVNRPHSSVLAIVDAERALQFSDNRAQQNSYFFENISHGQLQALSAALADSPSLAQSDQDRDGSSSAYVCTPPQIMEGRGVVKRFGNNRVLIVPMHADWFSPNSVHRLERQVVPHFFSGKSVEHTPEKYMECRNRIVAKYMGNPEKRLSLNDCQGLGVSIEMHDLSRIVRFLDHWGIINYSAATTNHEPRISGQYLREEPNGELHVPSPALRSIDSLIHFDKPKSRLKPSDVSSSPSCPSDEFSDLDRRIRELLSENHCYCCSRPLPRVYYQSQKEVDVLLCLDCFHEGRFVIGHSSMDFIRVDSMRELCDIDGDSWTDQETLLLLEALEIYNDNWNEIAEHVGTKSKAQCILHFVRLPMEDGLLENIEVLSKSVSANVPNIADGERQYANSNGHSIANLDSESRLPFASASNPLMSLVAFLASAVGPRVAAACAHASLAVLSKDDHQVAGSSNAPQMEGETVGVQGSNQNHAVSSPLPIESVNIAAKFGLAAAATKAKLFADHEEREIQRMAASIINHQLKRLELKLKQFAEVETLLMKECEQVERTRQRLAAERARVISTRFAPPGATATLPPVAAAAAAIANNSAGPAGTSRQQVISASPAQANIPGYGSNQPNHPNMFMPRQPMFAFGPRLPLSAIHPPTTAAAAASTVMYTSTQGSVPPGLTHPMLRPVSGTNTHVG